jgi:hypothetical protein
MERLHIKAHTLPLSAALLLFAAIAPTMAQVFDAPVPGVGHVRTKIGFAPGFNAGSTCEPLGSFPEGEKITTPFSTYIIITRPSTNKAVRLSYALRRVSPTGVEEVRDGVSTWLAGSHTWCWDLVTNRADEEGTYRYRFLINGVELGRLSLTVNRR